MLGVWGEERGTGGVVKDQNIKLHPFLVFEGCDVRENLDIVFSSFTNQILALEGEYKGSPRLDKFGLGNEP